jgi:hypothetical protein
MRSARVSALAVSVFAVGALTVGCTEPPPKENGGEGEGEGPQTCTVDGAELVRPDEGAFLPSGGTLDRSCMGNPRSIAEGAPITVEGCVDIFGLGGEAKSGINVALFRAGQDPAVDNPIVPEVEVAIADDSVAFDCEGADASEPACLATDCDKKGYYRITGAPSNVPVTMKVSKAGDNTVIDTYTFDVVFWEEDAVDGAYTYEASLIYRSTYDSIPTLAGKIVDGQQDIGDGVGRGVIAGEIRDCADLVIQGAAVTSSEFDSSSKITYFDGNEEDPKPDLRRFGTNEDGLYVLLNANTAAGSNVHTITAGMADPDDAEQCLALSSRTVRAYPDSVSIVTLRGDLPVEP